MDTQLTTATHTEEPTLATQTYEAPAVEAIVTLDALEREVHYAGVVNSGVNAA